MKTSALYLCTALLACASSKSDIDITKPVTGAEASNAGKAYERGALERKEQNYVEATRYFEFVKNNFPYSQYAALAELGIADMNFDREDWSAAATAYGDFIKSHPSHAQAPYASYRIGLAHYMDRPSDWFLFPPSYEKDQAPLRAALDGFNRFLASYPKSEFVPQAHIQQTDCRVRLARHERYVAEFYISRKQWRGAAGRFLTIADSFGDLSDAKVRDDALWRAADAYRNGNDPADERATLVRLVQESPGNPHRQQAEAMIKAIPADAKPPPLEPLPLPGQEPFARPGPIITPAETPDARGERPAAAAQPGEPQGASQPSAPEPGPKEPAGPPVQPPPPANQPAVPMPSPPPAQPDK